jgi:hypothetical protein
MHYMETVYCQIPGCGKPVGQRSEFDPEIVPLCDDRGHFEKVGLWILAREAEAMTAATQAKD